MWSASILLDIDNDVGGEDLRRSASSYLHHLFKVGDTSAERLATLHNLRFYTRLIGALPPRQAVSS